jgi:hypothetical protein
MLGPADNFVAELGGISGVLTYGGKSVIGGYRMSVAIGDNGNHLDGIPSFNGFLMSYVSQT